jgi:hypothetical protein
MAIQPKATDTPAVMRPSIRAVIATGIGWLRIRPCPQYGTTASPEIPLSTEPTTGPSPLR